MYHLLRLYEGIDEYHQGYKCSVPFESFAHADSSQSRYCFSMTYLSGKPLLHNQAKIIRRCCFRLSSQRRFRLKK